MKESEKKMIGEEGSRSNAKKVEEQGKQRGY